MKKTIVTTLLIVAFALNCALAQSVKRTNLEITIHTSFFETANQKVYEFIDANKVEIANQNSSTERSFYEFYVSAETFGKLQEFLPTVGYVSSKEISTTSNANTHKKTEIELQYLKTKKEAYATEIATMDKKDDRYYQYWEKIREIEREQYELEKDLASYSKTLEYYVALTIIDETIDLSSTKVSWVNMPGVSYDMFFVENPLSTVSAAQYQGYALRYMFTKGKSYVTLGALKEQGSAAADTMRYSELFAVGFGQDFYTHHFGRGKNRFFNLYTGYNVGGIYATADARTTTLAYLKVFLGVEIFKNKYMLIDNNVGYFVPFTENRNLRGITYSACFNFVF